MAWLKVYDWEHKTYTQFYHIDIDRKSQMKYLKKLSRHFKCSCPSLAQSYKRGGGGTYYKTWYGGLIKCHKITKLGLICHEFAHHLTQVRHGDGHHHDKTFKRELKRVYTWAKRWLPKEENHEETSTVQIEQDGQMQSSSNSVESYAPIAEPVSV